MEKKYRQTKLNKYQIEYNIETASTPLKHNKIINKEIMVNSFLQDAHNQKKQKQKVNLLSEKTIKEPKFNSIYLNKLERNKEKVKINLNNKEKLLSKNNNISMNSFHKKRFKDIIEIQDNNAQNTQLMHQIVRSSSNKSSVMPSSENQIIINSRNLGKINEKSFFENLGENKVKRHKTVYIKKNLSVDRNIRKSKNIYKNISQDYKIKYYNSNKKNAQQFYTPSTMTMRKESKDISNKNNTNNINSNVNIFNFGMQYSNSPHYFIRNSKMFNPYFNDYFAYNNQKINLDVDQYQNLVKSVILIQSAFRGCVVRFNINYLLIIYKKFEFLHYFFKNKFWNIFKNKLFIHIKNKISNCDVDSKLSISSISGFSALANSNLIKKNDMTNFNLKYLKETKIAFSILNNNNNIKQNIIKEESSAQSENNNKKIIWNKKMANKNNSLISNIIEQKLFSKNLKKLNMDKTETTNIKEKERYLKIIITKKIDKLRMILLKSFLKFYYNVKISNNRNTNIANNKEINIKVLKLEKLKKIIENINAYHFSLLYKFFTKIKYIGIINYIQNNQYLILNGGRLKNIEEDSFFIYEFSKQNKNIYCNKSNRNIKSILVKIIKLRKVIYSKKQTKNEIIKKYFDKFRMAGIRHYMQIELKKKLVIKNLIIKMNKENFNNIKDNKNETDNKKYKTLNKLILKYNNNYINCCKNIFDRWNLRTKLFSLISKDKEKKKKRRIKKRNNKKLAANIKNCDNNNINNFHIENDDNNINKINNDFSDNSNIKINIQKDKNEINIINYDVGHPDSIIFMNNLKITNYFTITKFINKLNGIITRKFYFFNIIVNNKKKEEDKKDDINNDVDFFMEDSSESEN